MRGNTVVVYIFSELWWTLAAGATGALAKNSDGSGDRERGREGNGR